MQCELAVAACLAATLYSSTWMMRFAEEGGCSKLLGSKNNSDACRALAKILQSLVDRQVGQILI